MKTRTTLSPVGCDDLFILFRNNMKAPTKLTVIIRDTTPLRRMQEPPTHRVVEIELTDDQRRKLILEVVDSDGRGDDYREYTEEVAQAILG